ncbi:MAG: hypothetical protein A2Y74_06140 [Actinobacteria bacterium RBG_13_63_9]|nr:MAG: hypothetical protein A2Y74_06140 [Actinobacteria bacterium RBG_13_63_9]
MAEIPEPQLWLNRVLVWSVEGVGKVGYLIGKLQAGDPGRAAEEKGAGKRGVGRDCVELIRGDHVGRKADLVKDHEAGGLRLWSAIGEVEWRGEDELTGRDRVVKCQEVIRPDVSRLSRVDAECADVAAAARRTPASNEGATRVLPSENAI